MLVYLRYVTGKIDRLPPGCWPVDYQDPFGAISFGDPQSALFDETGHLLFTLPLACLGGIIALAGSLRVVFGARGTLLLKYFQQQIGSWQSRTGPLGDHADRIPHLVTHAGGTSRPGPTWHPVCRLSSPAATRDQQGDDGAAPEISLTRRPLPTLIIPSPTASP